MHNRNIPDKVVNVKHWVQTRTAFSFYRDSHMYKPSIDELANSGRGLRSCYVVIGLSDDSLSYADPRATRRETAIPL